MDNLKSILESLLFTAGKPVEIRKLAKLTGAPENDILQELNVLSVEYKTQNRGIALVLQSGASQLVSAPMYGEFVKKIVTDELQDDLSRAAIETLSIIGYREPISRAAIEAVRGVNCVYILRNLLIRGLITKAKSERDGRMSVYEVSFDFLRHLGLQTTRDLPNFEELSKEVGFDEYIKEAEAAAVKDGKTSNDVISGPDAQAKISEQRP